MQATTPAEARLLTLVGEAVRGPKRDGLFALWLVLRAAEALLPPGSVSAKNHRRRLQALETRLASLACPRRSNGRSAPRATTSSPPRLGPPRWSCPSSSRRPGRCSAPRPATRSRLPPAPLAYIYRLDG